MFTLYNHCQLTLYAWYWVIKSADHQWKQTFDFRLQNMAETRKTSRMKKSTKKWDMKLTLTAHEVEKSKMAEKSEVHKLIFKSSIEDISRTQEFRLNHLFKVGLTWRIIALNFIQSVSNPQIQPKTGIKVQFGLEILISRFVFVRNLKKISRHRCQKKVRENATVKFERLKIAKNRLLGIERGTFELRFGF